MTFIILWGWVPMSSAHRLFFGCLIATSFEKVCCCAVLEGRFFGKCLLKSCFPWWNSKIEIIAKPKRKEWFNNRSISCTSRFWVHYECRYSSLSISRWMNRRKVIGHKHQKQICGFSGSGFCICSLDVINSGCYQSWTVKIQADPRCHSARPISRSVLRPPKGESITHRIHVGSIYPTKKQPKRTSIGNINIWVYLFQKMLVW